MRLRQRPDDVSLPWPELKAVEPARRRSAYARHPVRGSTLETMSQRARRSLLSLMLAAPVWERSSACSYWPAFLIAQDDVGDEIERFLVRMDVREERQCSF
jgi:hypothetical protein